MGRAAETAACPSLPRQPVEQTSRQVMSCDQWMVEPRVPFAGGLDLQMIAPLFAFGPKLRLVVI
jgi:hypothetical protein